jgi:hypothetical protein
MAYILAAERRSTAETGASFQRYHAYLKDLRGKFPVSAYALATSEWYFDAQDHRCPHDAWLEHVAIRELAEGGRRERRTITLEVRLLGAYHDGYIMLRYPRVFSYRLDAWDGSQGHQDWRYDEFRLSDSGHLLHEIEWTGLNSTSRWLIEASDIEYKWEPFASAR